MTNLLDGAAAVPLFGILNAFLIVRIGSSQPRSEGAFLARVCTTTLLLRAVLAILSNVFAAASVFAGAFWGDSGTYDGGGYALARHWQGDAVGTSLTQALSGYGFVYSVGALYYVFGRNQLMVQLPNCTVMPTPAVAAAEPAAARMVEDYDLVYPDEPDAARRA